MPHAAADTLRGIEYADALKDAPLFTAGDEQGLGEFLGSSLAGGGGIALLPTLVNGRHSPSKKLLESVGRALEGSPVWTLLDEQRVAFNLVRGHVERASKTGEKAVILVVGGPGTGKSVIAVHVLVALSKLYRVAHTTASKAFTTNLRAVGGRGSNSLFCWNKDFAHKLTAPNALDVLLIDEAHRVRLTSNMQYTGKQVKSDIPQANELIRAARVSVFLLDERQNVRPDEIGSVSALEDAAEAEGVPVTRVDLNAQFRCNGSAEYIEWVGSLLSERPVKAGGWLGAGEYDLRLYGSPAALEAALREKLKAGMTARMVAGFCWEWSDPLDGALVADVAIGTWTKPWNEKSPEQFKKRGPQPRPDKHPYTKWATLPQGFEQVGCTYSAQGFEFDYCGVIFGNDLVWRDGVGWIASKGESWDPAIKRRKHTPEGLRILLQQTYRVLMTRGIVGTYVYSTDEETRAFLKAVGAPNHK